jgi:hypothetical protein
MNGDLPLSAIARQEEAVISEFDGVLIDSNRAHFASWREPYVKRR